MATKYSRQQILEKLEFWKKELAKIDESKSLLIDRLIEHFGENVVLSLDDSVERINLTLEMANTIYDVANEIMFKNKLSKIDIVAVPNPPTLKISSFVYASYDDKDGNLVIIRKKFVDKAGNVFYPPRIEIPRMVFEVKMPFMFIASAIVHEMIHQYDVDYGTEAIDLDNDEKSEKEHDSHGDLFKKFMKIANEEYGMSVEIKCDLTKLADEFRAAILNARAKILENDEDKNIVYQTEDLIVEQPKNSSIRIVHMN